MIDTSTMQKCTEAYKNDCWVLRTDENKLVGTLRAQPFETLAERLQKALQDHYDMESTDIKIKILKELADEIHELKVFIPTDIEDGYYETIELTPAWEY